MASTKTFDAGTVYSTYSMETKKFHAEVKKVEQKLDELERRNIDINVDVDSGGGQTSLAELRRQLNALERDRVDINVDVDTARAQLQLELLNQRLKSLDDSITKMGNNQGMDQAATSGRNLVGMIASMSPLLPLLAGVGTGLAAVAGTLVGAAGAAGAFGLAAVPAFKFAKDGIERLNEAEAKLRAAKTLEERTAALKELNAAQRELGASGMALAASWKAFSAQWTAFQNATRPAVFQTFAAALGAAGAALQAIQPIVKPVADLFTNMFTSIENSIRAGFLREFISWLGTAGVNHLRLWGQVGGTFGEGFLRMLMLLAPLGEKFLHWLHDVGSAFTSWTESEEGRRQVADWMATIERVAPKVLATLSALSPVFKILWEYGTLLGSALMSVVNGFDALVPGSAGVLLGLGLVVASVIKLTLGLNSMIIATKAASLAMVGFATSLRAAAVAHPILAALTLITIALMALWVHSETFRNIVKGAFQAVGDAAMWLWREAIKPSWDAIVAASNWLWNTSLRPTWEAIKVAWFALGDAIMWTWNTLLKPVWDAMGAASIWLWNNTLKPTWDAMKVAWDLFAASMDWTWKTLIKPVWDAMGAAGSWLWNTILKPVWDAMKAAWNSLSDGIGGGWTEKIKPVWDVIGNAFQTIWTDILKPIWEGMKAAWIILTDAIKWGWDKAVQPVWDAIGTVFETMWRTVLEPTWNFMRTQWDKLSGGIKSSWEEKIKPAWDAMGAVFKYMWENILQPAWNFMAEKWTQMTERIDKAWKEKLKPVWDEFRDKVRELWEKHLEPIWEKMKLGWEVLSSRIAEIWNTRIRPVWDEIKKEIQELWDRVGSALDSIGLSWERLGMIFGGTAGIVILAVVGAIVAALAAAAIVIGVVLYAIGAAFVTTAAQIEWAWNNVIKPSWEFMERFAKRLGEKLKEIWDSLKKNWEDLSGFFKRQWENEIRPVWEDIQGFAQRMSDRLNEIFDSIERAWDSLTGSFNDSWSRDGEPTFSAMQGDSEGLRNWMRERFREIEEAWAGMCGFFQRQWDNTIRPAWAAVERGAEGLRNWLRDRFADIERAWDGMVNFLQRQWDNILRNTWAAVERGAEGLRNWLRDRFADVERAWDGLVNFIQRQWDNVLRNTWAAVERGAEGLRNWIHDRLADIERAWDGMVNFIQRQWDSILRNTWAAVERGAEGLRNWLRDRFADIERAWDGLVNFFRRMWETHLRETWAAIERGAEGLRNWLRDRMADIERAWDGMVNFIRHLWETALRPTWDRVAEGLGWLRDRFNETVTQIGQIWDRLRELMAAPIRFMVNTVWNEGIVPAWNRVAELLGLGRIDTFALPFAEGGKHHEHHTAQRSPRGSRTLRVWGEPETHGEYYIPRAKSKRPRATQYLNMAANDFGFRLSPKDSGRIPQHQKFADGGIHISQFADAGVWRTLKQIVESGVPGARMTSGYRPGSRGSGGGLDYHSQGMAADFGGPLAQINKFIADNYGSTSLELIYTPGINIKNGQPITYSAGVQAGHYDHVHWASRGDGGDPVAGGGGGFFSPLLGMLTAAWDSLVKPAMDKLKGFVGEPPPRWREVPIGLATKIADGAKNYLMSKLPFTSAGSPGGVPQSAEHWRPVVLEALRILGQPEAYADLTLRRLMQESGGNPGAINNWDSNARKGTPSKGLMQLIDPTFRMVAVPPHNVDIWDPLSNILAGMRWALYRYGSLPAAFNRPGGYDTGGWLKPGETGVNNLRKPEAVLNPNESTAFVELSKWAQRNSSEFAKMRRPFGSDYTPPRLESAARALERIAKTLETKESGPMIGTVQLGQSGSDKQAINDMLFALRHAARKRDRK